MTIRDLLKRVPEEDYDKVLIITMPDGGWTNIENAVSNGSAIELSMDISNSPFTSDK